MSDTPHPTGSEGPLIRRLPGGPYALLLAFIVLAAVGLGLSRAGLVLWQWPEVDRHHAAVHILVQGLRSDLMAAGWAIAPLLLLLPVLTLMRRQRTWFTLASRWLPAVGVFLALMELVTPSFMLEFGVRPNRTFAEYLVYPRDVASMVWAAYKGPVLAAFAALVVIGWLLFRLFARASRAESWTAGRTLAAWPVAVLATLLMIRSNTQGPPVHLGNFAFCDDPMVNSLVANSAYTMLYSVYQIRRETGLSVAYGTLPHAEVVRNVRASMAVPSEDFLSDDYPTLHRQSARSPRTRPVNLVLVLAESLGAKFVRRLGGQDLAPNLDRWADQGIWFERLYATGTRTSRGVEAVVSGFPPTPALSVVKLSKAQQGFFTLGSALHDSGYRNEFVYGGDADFDNLRRFFLNNGFQRVQDQADFASPVFRGYLGVSDEDLFDKVFERMGELHASGQPFFLLTLTLSHHPPHDFPDGRIQLAQPVKEHRDNSALYADYALGRFLERARASPLWSDTLFVVVADHEAHLRSTQRMPLSEFHIPGLILGAGVSPMKVQSVASQIDLAPTLLSLLGIDAVTPFVGRDLTRTLPDFGNAPPLPPPRAVMQYFEHFGWLEGTQLMVLSPDGNDAGPEPDVTQFRFDPATGAIEPDPLPDANLYRRALAEALLPAWLYSEQRYTRPPDLLSGI